MPSIDLELLLARSGATSGERRGLARDADRGLLVRVRPGVYAGRTAWVEASPEQRHVVAMRALAAVAASPPVFSHWSAAELHGLPVLRTHLDRVHVAVEVPTERNRVGVQAHLAPLDAAHLVELQGLRVTSVERTVVDVALVAAFADGVITADGALRAGVDRDALADVLDGAAGRRGLARAQAVVAFARAEAESAAESLSRATMLRLGVPPPVLQFEVLDAWGLAGRLDFWFPHLGVGGEVDGEQKYLDPRLAADGAGRAVVREKRREDRLRRSIAGLARWGWPDSGSTSRLGPILAVSGVRSSLPRATLTDYCAMAEHRI